MAQLARLAGSKTRNGSWTEKFSVKIPSNFTRRKIQYIFFSKHRLLFFIAVIFFLNTCYIVEDNFRIRKLKQFYIYIIFIIIHKYK